MDKRYTEEVRRSIFFAQYEARQSNSPLVETQHLLLGILREAPALVQRFNISETSMRDLVHESENTGGSTELSNVPLSDESKDVLRSAMKEADRMSSKHIGIDHLLLGILRDNDCAAAKILNKYGATFDRVRTELEVVPYQGPSNETRSGQILDELIASMPSHVYPNSERFRNFTERARRAVFFARAEASQFCSPSVETYQLLLGVLREGIPRTDLFMPLGSSKETLYVRIEEYAAGREKVLESPGLPFSEECEQVLANAEEEAAKLKHRQVGLEHLLLGLLKEEDSLAAQLLRERGAQIESIRQGLAS